MELDKIINAWECCTDEIGVNNCDKCPYVGYRYDGCMLILKKDTIDALKESKQIIERLEYDLAVTQNNLNHYVNGND